MSKHKPRILVDFDGVIHKYSYGWMDGTAYDSPMKGALEALEEMTAAGLEVVIFSTRDSNQITEWLEKNHFPAYRVTNVKEPAEVIIDDRAIRFETWNQVLVDLESLHGIRTGT